MMHPRDIFVDLPKDRRPGFYYFHPPAKEAKWSPFYVNRQKCGHAAGPRPAPMLAVCLLSSPWPVQLTWRRPNCATARHLFAQAVHLPPSCPSSDENADRALSPERDGLGVAAASQAARYDVNDKPSVRRAIEPFHCQRDE